MANRDIAGLLTGIPSGGLTGREMLAQSAMRNQQRMGSALAQAVGRPAPPSQQVALGLAQKKREQAIETLQHVD